ncbi:DUF3800 domain-containing protein [Agromyces sp. NPDC058126]|uniref:DUF3800 domain-containing protein n=1 Tax=Agromyces sp. NPDC058126 TaxID=3346350 RepID=UPI0036DE761E
MQRTNKPTTTYPAGCRVYVDECKTKGYYIAAAIVMPNNAAQLEKELRKLARPGQRRIHFTNESDSSRRSLISAVEKLGIRGVVYQVKGTTDRIARPLCLEALINDLVTHDARHLILERDESVEVADRRIIAETLRRHDAHELRYQHAAGHEHALLWVSDMIAWCAYKGGDWRRRIEPLIIETRTLTP